MSTGVTATDLVTDLVTSVQAGQSSGRRRANTITSGIGAIATAIAAGIAYLLEAGVDLPSWVTLLVAVCGMSATTLGVSRTRNGMTASIATDLLAELARRDAAPIIRGDTPAGGGDAPAGDMRSEVEALGRIATGSLG